MSEGKAQSARIGLCVAVLLATSCRGQAPDHTAHDLPAEPPRTWAADASENEIAVIEHREVLIRYRMHVLDEKGNQLRDVIESRDGSVARLIKRDDRPLTATEDSAEHDRLKELLTSPAAYQKHEANDVTGKKRAVELIRMLPDAMVYSYVPGQPQIESASGPQVVIDFSPNPEWHPPTLPSQALTGLRGRVWVDRRTHHMVRMDGEIFQSVSVGWGMLARLYPGGHLSLDQAAIGDTRWVFTHFAEQLTVRALMLKTIHQSADVTTSGYQRIQPMSYQEAIRVLLATPLPQ